MDYNSDYANEATFVGSITIVTSILHWQFKTSKVRPKKEKLVENINGNSDFFKLKFQDEKDHEPELQI